MVFSPSDPDVPRHRPLRSSLSFVTGLVLAGLLCVSSPAVAKDASSKKASKSEKTAQTESDADAQENGQDSDAEEDSAAENIAAGDVNAEEGGSAAPSGAGLGASAAATGGPGNTIVFIDGGLRSDQGRLLQRDVVGRFEQEEHFDVKAFGPMLHVGFLTKLFWQLRVGAAFGYGSNHLLKERLTKFEQEQEQEPEEWVVGQLHTLDIRLEFSQFLGGDFWLVATPRGGVQAVLIGNALKRETRQYEDSHVVRQGPQPGFIFGGDLGLRYMVLDWFSLRATGGYSYSHQGLLKAKRRGDAADSDHLWRSTATRIGANIGLEVNF